MDDTKTHTGTLLIHCYYWEIAIFWCTLRGDSEYNS